MAVLVVNPDFAHTLAELGLNSPEASLRLPGVIYSGHPDRHVMRVQLPRGDAEIPCFLKREHRVRWRDRVANAWQRFGLISKSLREWRTLRQLATLGIGCPEAIAAGETKDGRAFLLVRQAEGAHDLRDYLAGPLSEEDRVTLARGLGEAVANIHAAGFCHGDLFSKHVLVTLHGVARNVNSPFQFVFLDWQRAWRVPRLAWTARLRDLAALNATLADEIIPDLARRALREAYCDSCSRQEKIAIPAERTVRAQIEAQSLRLLRNRKIHEVRQRPLPSGEQNLIWLNGEALCVTRQFLDEIDTQPVVRATLSQRTENCFLRRCWQSLRRKKMTSPELHQAATIFRLERFRVRVPRLLAVGQRLVSAGRMSSFLLTRPVEGQHLGEWLRGSGLRESSREMRRWLIQQAAELLRAIHAAECLVGERAALMVQFQDGQPPQIGLNTVAGTRSARRICESDRWRDLARFLREYGLFFSRTEQLRFLLWYSNEPKLDAQAKRRISAVITGPSKQSPKSSEVFELVGCRA